MADEVFALSPISARAAQPSEEDYAAIHAAFMETSRGRWFLGEYAKRNRNADTHLVLDAVARIEESLAAQKESAAEADLAEALASIRKAVEEAQAFGRYVCAHAYSPEAITRAAHLGVRTIEHGNLIDDASAKLMAEKDMFLVRWAKALYAPVVRVAVKMRYAVVATAIGAFAGAARGVHEVGAGRRHRGGDQLAGVCDRACAGRNADGDADA